MKRLQIGVDMDGVLLDCNEVWARHYNRSDKDHPHAEEVSAVAPTWSYYPDSCETCFHDCVHLPDLILDTPFMPDACMSIVRLQQVADLHLISHRGLDVIEACEQRLFDEGLGAFFATKQWNWEPKTETCERLGIDIMLDDSPKNIIQLSGTNTVPVIFDWPYNRQVPGLRVFNWMGFVRMVVP